MGKSTTTTPAGSGQSFAELFEQSSKIIDVGEVTMGKVVAIRNDYALIDIGDKSETEIAIAEFKDNAGEIEIQVVRRPLV